MDNPYNDCKVYMLYIDGLDEVYIGSTTQTLERRLSMHKSNSKKIRKCKSQILFKTGKEVKIKLLEDCYFDTKEELLACERKHIERNKNCVNKYIPGRTQQEYNEKNKDKIKKYHKEYNKKYYKEYEETNKKYHKEYNKKYCKEYYEKNKNKIIQQQKAYRAKKNLYIEYDVQKDPSS